MRVSEKPRPPGRRCRPTYSSSSVTVFESKPDVDGVHGLYAGSIRSSVAMRSPPVPTVAAGTVVTAETRGTSVQFQEHPAVAERVGFDVLEAEELGHAGVVGAAQLVVGLVIDRGALDLDEAGPSEELGLERQRE